MNIREIAGINCKYSEMNREERNYAAILFSALCRPGNPERFLDFCGFKKEIGPEFGIYFEYAYLRDLWWKINDEETKKQIVREQLRINGIDDILQLPTVEINRTFGVAGQPSANQIQFPGKWALVKFAKNFVDNQDLLKICRFKWSFNIKPDIVIHLSNSKAICIEAKYESSEGSYPSSEVDKSIFRERGMKYVGQIELQDYMMEELLGIDTEFMFLVHKKEQSKTARVITWAEAFEGLDMDDMPSFAIEMANRISA